MSYPWAKAYEPKSSFARYLDEKGSDLLEGGDDFHVGLTDNA